MLDQKDRIILVAQLADSFIARIADATFTEAVVYGLKVLETTEMQLGLTAPDHVLKKEEELVSTELKPWMEWVQEGNYYLLVAYPGSDKESVIVHFFPAEGTWYIDNPDYSTHFQGSVNTDIGIEAVKKNLQHLIPMKAWSEWDESFENE